MRTFGLHCPLEVLILSNACSPLSSSFAHSVICYCEGKTQAWSIKFSSRDPKSSLSRILIVKTRNERRSQMRPWPDHFVEKCSISRNSVNFSWISLFCMILIRLGDIKLFRWRKQNIWIKIFKTTRRQFNSWKYRGRTIPRHLRRLIARGLKGEMLTVRSLKEEMFLNAQTVLFLVLHWLLRFNLRPSFF